MSHSPEGQNLPSEFFTGTVRLPGGIERATAYYADLSHPLGLTAVRKLVQITGIAPNDIHNPTNHMIIDAFQGFPAYDLRIMVRSSDFQLGPTSDENIEFQVSEAETLERILAFGQTHAPAGPDSLIINDEIALYAPVLARGLKVQGHKVDSANPHTGFYL